LINVVLWVETKIEGEGVFNFLKCKAERVADFEHETCRMLGLWDEKSQKTVDIRLKVLEWSDRTQWLVAPPPTMLWRALGKIAISQDGK